MNKFGKYVIPETLNLEAAMEDLFIHKWFADEWYEDDDWDILVIAGLNSVFVAPIRRLGDTPRVIARDKDGEVFVSSGGATNGTLGATLDLDSENFYQGDEALCVAENFPLPEYTSWYTMSGLCLTKRFRCTSEKSKQLLAEKVNKLIAERQES